MAAHGVPHLRLSLNSCFKNGVSCGIGWDLPGYGIQLAPLSGAGFWTAKKGKYLCPIGAQKISCFSKNQTKMRIFCEKWKMSVPFGKTGKRPCPNNTVLQRTILCCGAKPFSQISQNRQNILYGEALEKFQKGKAIFQNFFNEARSTPFRSQRHSSNFFWLLSEKSAEKRRETYNLKSIRERKGAPARSAGA